MSGGTPEETLNNHIKVLIVEDDPSQRSGYAALVSTWGMIPETASDGNEALAKLNDFPADVIVRTSTPLMGMRSPTFTPVCGNLS